MVDVGDSYSLNLGLPYLLGHVYVYVYVKRDAAKHGPCFFSARTFGYILEKKIVGEAAKIANPGR